MTAINSKDISDFFGKLSIVFIILSFYFLYLVEYYTLNTSFRKWTLLIALVFYGAKILFYRKLSITNLFLSYALLAIPLLFLSGLFWFSLDEFNVYFTLITSIVIITSGLDYFKKVLKILIYLILLIAIFEYINKIYIFEVYRETQWGLKAFDPKFFGGFSKIFRAKALFEGPLGLAQFAIGIGLLFRKQLKIVLIALALSIFANGRLGIIICLLILIFYFIEKYDIVKFLKSKKGMKVVLFSLIAFIIFTTYFIDEKSLERFKNVFEVSDSANTGRFYYWIEAINLFFKYDFFHFIFGNSGYYRSVTGNSAENGWLMLLLNNGVLGFLYYSFPLFGITLLSIKYRTHHFMFIILIVFAMMIQTFHLGASASLFYWLIIYTYYYEFKEKRKMA